MNWVVIFTLTLSAVGTIGLGLAHFGIGMFLLPFWPVVIVLGIGITLTLAGLNHPLGTFIAMMVLLIILEDIFVVKLFGLGY